MSQSNMSSLTLASQYFVIYAGLFIFIAGLIGGPLVLVVFLSLQTFRQNSCAFYLTVMSLVNTIQLFTGLLTYVMINGFGINWTDMSLFYCKFRPFYLQSCALMSLTCMCLAIIDQFLATCSHPRWHQWNNIKLARSMVTGTLIICLLHGIPLLIYFNHTVSFLTGNSICVITNTIFRQYYIVVYVSVLTCILPLISIILFGILAYRNVQQIAYRTVPLVRRELDKQLTVMVLVQVFYAVLVVSPIIIQTIFVLIIGTPTDSFTAMQLRLVTNVTTTVYYFHYAGGFYIYVCACKRFRQQLIYVLFTVHLNRWYRRGMINNQIEPQL